MLPDFASNAGFDRIVLNAANAPFPLSLITHPTIKPLTLPKRSRWTEHSIDRPCRPSFDPAHDLTKSSRAIWPGFEQGVPVIRHDRIVRDLNVPFRQRVQFRHHHLGRT
ncbi:MAG TPA: hypothetical protein VEA63_17060 [Opitutus sp.]|nr:hypothetical protein [Opitutus sp.]